MSYTITYKFGTMPDVGEAVAGDHLIRMTLIYTVEGDGTNLDRFARDYGIEVISWGKLSWRRELDENFMVPGQYDFELFDGSGALFEIMFEGEIAPLVNKNATVILEIKYTNTASYVVEYKGNIDNQNIQYDKKNNQVKFSAFPQTDILKSIYLYDEDTANPGKYKKANPLNINFTETPRIPLLPALGNIFIADEVNVKTLIHDIFKKINSSCTLSWQHSWLFEGWNLYATPDNYTEFELEDLVFSSNYLSSLFFSVDNLRRFETLYDLLMGYAFTFGFICGMITSDKAFVKDINSYNAANTQTLGLVKDHIVLSKYGDVEAVRIQSGRYLRDSKGGANAYTESDSYIAVVPYGSQVRGENIIDKELACWAHRDIFTNNFTNYDLRGGYGGNGYEIARVETPGGLYVSLQNKVAMFYYNLRNRRKVYPYTVVEGVNANIIGRVDELTVENINYDYLKDFPYGGNGYQILSLEKDIANNESIINALVVADVVEDSDTEDGDGYPKPFTNILPGGYLKTYEYNSEITIEDANALTSVLYKVKAGTLIKRITMIFVEAFDNVTSINITDSDGTLKQSSEIIWDIEGAVLDIAIYKQYSADDDITITFTKSATVTTGQIDCIVELSRRD